MIYEAKVKDILKVIGLIVVLIAVPLTFFAISRAGKTEVQLYTAPDAATIKVDDGSTGESTYLKPGSHTVTASLDGWKNIRQDIVVEEDEEFYFVFQPDSDEARDAILNDEEIISQRESFTALNAQKDGLEKRQSDPIINKLPYSDISGPFKIDYGYRRGVSTNLFLEVSYSTVKGRQLATEWIMRNTNDITKLEVEFVDYINPLVFRSIE